MASKESTDLHDVLYHTHQFAIMMLAVATILHVVQIVARLLTKKAETLGAGHVELLLTS